MSANSDILENSSRSFRENGINVLFVFELRTHPIVVCGTHFKNACRISLTAHTIADMNRVKVSGQMVDNCTSQERYRF